MVDKKSFEPLKTKRVGSLVKTAKTVTRLNINVFADKVYLDIRSWFKKGQETEFKPGKGMSLDINALYRLRKLLNKAIKMAEAMEVVDNDEVDRINESFSKRK
jgi:hypothetical protein